MASNIVLADAQATPVNHTFVPVGLDKDGVYWFTDQSQANAIGFWRISVQITQPASPKGGENSASRVYRYRIGLHEPLLETLSNNTVSGIAPAPTVSYVPRAFTEYIMPERSALLDRKNLRKMSYLLQNDTQVVGWVENLTQVL